MEHGNLFIDKELYFRNQRQFGPGLLFVVIAMLCCYVDPKSGLALKTSFKPKIQFSLSVFITDEFVVIKC